MQTSSNNSPFRNALLMSNYCKHQFLPAATTIRTLTDVSLATGEKVSEKSIPACRV